MIDLYNNVKRDVVDWIELCKHQRIKKMKNKKNIYMWPFILSKVMFSDFTKNDKMPIQNFVFLFIMQKNFCSFLVCGQKI